MTEAASETLKQQFQLLQQQQQEKLLRRKKKKEEKEQSNLSSASKAVSFGVDDNLELKLADPVPKTSSYLSEELVEHLNDQIRELKDENARVYKLLSEKDFEVRQIKKKAEEQVRAGGGVTNETAATKIVDLSKKIRELTAELESERTKSKTYARKCLDLQKQLSNIPEETRSMLSSAVSLRTLSEEKSEEHVDVKPLQDKIKQMEMKVSEYRNQSTSLKQELKIAHKVLSQELGENVNIQSILNSQSNWRGRAQQILSLQLKVEELKSQLAITKPQKQEYDLEAEMMGYTSARSRTAVDRHKEQLRKVEKERKEAQEKAANTLKALEEDHAALKKKFDAAKTRNNVLSTQNKSLKEQMKPLVEKGQHDDELIAALVKQQSHLKELLEESAKSQSETSNKTERELKQMTMKSQHDTNIVEQLKSIVMEKESKVHKLEREIEQLKLNHLQKAQMESANMLFQAPGQDGPRPPSHLKQYFDSRPSTADNNVNVEFAVTSVTPSQFSSRMSDRPPSVNSALDRCPSVSSTVDTARTVTVKGRVKTPTFHVNNVDKQKMDDLQSQTQEHQTMRRVAEVERDKLSELVQILQSRLDEATKGLTECQSDLVQERRKTVLLEKQVGKNKIEQTTTTGKGGSATARRKGQLRASSTTNISVSASFSAPNPFEDEENFENIEEIRTNLEIQKDENAALKAALERTLQAKEEDLRLYSEMMEETKRVFLQALRQYKQNAQGT